MIWLCDRGFIRDSRQREKDGRGKDAVTNWRRKRRKKREGWKSQRRRWSESVGDGVDGSDESDR